MIDFGDRLGVTVKIKIGIYIEGGIGIPFFYALNIINLT